MELFTNRPRTDQTYAKTGERSFSFLNRSGREEFAVVREKLNNWFSHYPKQEQFELKRSLQSAMQFDYAFFELYVHEFFYSRGYQLEIHPELEHTTKQPDFLISKNGKALFYLEAKVVTDESDAERSYQEKQNRIASELDKLGNFPYWISIREIEIKNDSSFSVKPVIREIKKVAKALDYQKMLSTYEKEILNYDDENISIEISLRPRSNSSLNEMNRAVGVRGYFESGYVDTSKSLSRAIEDKARKYGKPNLPLVIAVNCISPLHFAPDDLEIVLGKDFRFIKSNSTIPNSDRIITEEGIFSKSFMNRVPALFITWVTPYHQNDEQWYWCPNPNFENKEFQESLINQIF